MICRDTPTHGWVCGWLSGSVGQWVGQWVSGWVNGWGQVILLNIE